MSDRNEVREVKLDDLDLDLQTRDCLDTKAVAEYAKAIQDGETFPRAVVFDDGDQLYLASGFHRREAYRKAGRDSMPCVIRNGTRWDAVQVGLRDNWKFNGVRVTRAAKRHSIGLVLREQPEMSDSAIAKLVKCSDKTVAKVRAEMKASFGIPNLEYRIGADGKSYPASKPVNNGQKRTDEQQADSAPCGQETTDKEHCKCGGQWISDGNGGRYCEQCQADFPNGQEAVAQVGYTDETETIPEIILDGPLSASDSPISTVGCTCGRCLECMESEDLEKRIPLFHKRVLQAFDNLCIASGNLEQIHRNAPVQAKLNELRELLQTWVTAN